MAGFFSKIFGGGSKKNTNGVRGLVEDTLQTLIEKSGLELDFDISTEEDESGDKCLNIEVSGSDDRLMKDKEGQLIDAFQLFLQRVIQHNFAEDKTKITIDCGGYREESSQALIELADKLKDVAIEKGRSVYFRALPPKDRKIVHQHLASDERVKSRSVGEGLYKKIKIYPSKNNSNKDHHSSSQPD